MMTTMSNGVVVRPIEQGDHQAWEQLFHAYRTFYEYDEEQDVVDCAKIYARTALRLMNG